MEGNLNLLPGGDRSYGGLELQNSIRFNQQQPPDTLQPHHQIHSHGRKGPSVNNVFTPLTIGTMQDCYHPILRGGYNKDECPKTTMSDEDEPSLTEDAAVDGKYEVNKGEKRSTWKRVKWTDKMVRVLITAVSYVGEDAESEYVGGVRTKYAIMQKKGKWKSVSKVMAERDYFVSPQQCEDKFNDLNKRYKRLNDVLGRGTSCQVVENPALLDMMDHLSVKAKDDVRKILSSKHLFYEEMCSYHNGNRLHLPPDPALQRSLQLALRSRDDNENNEATRLSQDDFDEEEHDEESEDHDPYEETHAIHGIQRGSGKRMKPGQGFEEFSFGNPINLHDCHKISQSDPQPSQCAVTKQTSLDGSKACLLKNEWLVSCSHELEERKIELHMAMFELEKQRFEWQRVNKKKDMELEKMRMENERMKLENVRIKLELKRKGIMSKDCN